VLGGHLLPGILGVGDAGQHQDLAGGTEGDRVRGLDLNRLVVGRLRLADAIATPRPECMCKDHVQLVADREDAVLLEEVRRAARATEVLVRRAQTLHLLDVVGEVELPVLGQGTDGATEVGCDTVLRLTPLALGQGLDELQIDLSRGQRRRHVPTPSFLGT